MRTPKAANLARLAELVDVPPFAVVSRDRPAVPSGLSTGGRFLVRGCMLQEDSPGSSLAGRSPTIGPVAHGDLASALGSVFRTAEVEECLVQDWRDGPSGVVFCLSGEEAVVEYSALHGGVTSGKLDPFAALLPCAQPRYDALSRGVFRIHQACGPCDLEFVGLERPAFVQMRPITSRFTYDRGLVELKMALQELDEPAWRCTEFCVDLMERPERDGALQAEFLRGAQALWSELRGPTPRLPARPFLKIGRQIFLARGLEQALLLTTGQRVRLALSYARELAQVRRDLQPGSQADAGRLMRAALLLNLYTDLFTRRLPRAAAALFQLRERCRQALARALPCSTAPTDIAFDRRLSSEIVRGDERLEWLSLGLDDSPGAVVVPGEFESGPFFLYRGQPDDVPAGAILLTEELYPALAPLLPRVRGIVAAGGAFGSHLAILAREQKVPLMIQAARFVRAHAGQG